MGIIRQSEAEWKGDLMSGEGFIKFGSKAFEGPYSFKGRTTDQSSQTNPEELMGAAHAGCFSMQLSALLSKDGHPPQSIHSTAKVHLDSDAKGFLISQIDLETEAKVSGITAEAFEEYAHKAKELCPVSRALASVKINFKAVLLG
jgi:osmotically inducible protein OsmC